MIWLAQIPPKKITAGAPAIQDCTLPHFLESQLIANIRAIKN
jgi:hypothetical protein